MGNEVRNLVGFFHNNIKKLTAKEFSRQMVFAKLLLQKYSYDNLITLLEYMKKNSILIYSLSYINYIYDRYINKALADKLVLEKEKNIYNSMEEDYHLREDNQNIVNNGSYKDRFTKLF